MNRSRSVSRRPSFRLRDDSISPTRSASRSSSIGSAFKADRSRSQSPAPSAYHRREQASSSSISKSTVLAGIGIAALVARKFWPKSSSSGSSSNGGNASAAAERDDRSSHARRAARDWQGPRGRGVERRSHRQASTLSGCDHGRGRPGMRGDDAGYYLREPRRRSVDRRSWGGDDARSNVQSATGYGRGYS
ncbi:hypothetical protein NLG97_g6450 [Lecanicillium saksenae]|uniref:Uncharacterized protein n=1 Tax=Lecanicillium saksenae TaxID=468837 RepID=A0ACC1QQX9_9HYPO|nr:hypothetical protein NLG97_g6450 [Lecanicillium saksenae]